MNILPRFTGSRLEDSIFYATGLLIADAVVGYVATGRPLHESLGIDLSSTGQLAEDAAMVLGWGYCLVKSAYVPKPTSTNKDQEYAQKQ